MEFLAIAVLVVALLVAVGLLLRRAQDPAALHSLELVSRSLGQLQSELTRVVRTQDDLRRDVQQTREASFKQVADATLGIRGESGGAEGLASESASSRAEQANGESDDTRSAGKRGGRIASRCVEARTSGRDLGQLPPIARLTWFRKQDRRVRLALRRPVIRSTQRTRSLRWSVWRRPKMNERRRPEAGHSRRRIRIRGCQYPRSGAEFPRAARGSRRRLGSAPRCTARDPANCVVVPTRGPFLRIGPLSTDASIL